MWTSLMITIPQEFEDEDQCKQWLKDHPYYCAKPFYSKEISQRGEYSWCCHWQGDTFPLQKFSDFDRSIFLENKPIKECSFCYNVEKSGTLSERFNESTYALYYKRHWIDSVNIKYMVIFFNNLCNVACRMCSESLSTLWGKKVKGVDNLQKIPDNIWNNILQDVKTVEHVSLLGGETFLSDRFFELMQADHNIREIQFQTNCTVYKKEFLDELSKLESVVFGLSIDGIGPVNEYTRWPSNWEKIQHNIDKFFEYKFNFMTNPVINIYTVYYFDQLLDFWYDYMKKDVNIIIAPQFCLDPQWMNMAILPQDVLDIIKERTEKLLDHDILKEFPLQTDILLDALNSIINICKNSQHEENIWQDFKNQTTKWNMIQSMTLEKYLPEFSNEIKTK